MTRRDVLWAIVIAIAAVVGFVLFGLLLAAQTVGVEAWHDSAVPQVAFRAIAGTGVKGDGDESGNPSQGRPDGTHRTPGIASTSTPSPSLRAVPRLAAIQVAARTSPASMTGISSWYSYIPGQAAAGPALRAALGPNWRRTVVTVSANGFSVRVQLTDSCQCYGTRLVDLDVRDFSQLAPLSQGLTEVTISWK